ncbi:MAG TPA: hypothetical protein VIW26_16685 [Gemmatimonadales bacterium]
MTKQRVLGYAIKGTDGTVQLESSEATALMKAVRISTDHPGVTFSIVPLVEQPDEPRGEWNVRVPEPPAPVLVESAPSDERAAALQDRAYCHGAQQALAMAHQSLAAADKWFNDGCGGRAAPAIATENRT